jgi:hypothetical protein
MGYACPVCSEPQADGEHLANHLAFSAMLGRADHADWLDEHAPGWSEEDPEGLAERVTDHAETVELDVETDSELPDPPAGMGAAGAGPGGLESALSRQSGPGRERLDPETQEIIAEAREMTRRRRDADDEPAGGDETVDADDEPAGGDETVDADDEPAGGDTTAGEPEDAAGDDGDGTDEKP